MRNGTERSTSSVRRGGEAGKPAVYGENPLRRRRSAASLPTVSAPESRITSFSPADLHETGGYHHVTITTTGRTAYLAGQCPLDRDENVVGIGDHGAQADQVAANCLIALTAAGARPEDVVRSWIYVVGDDPAVLAGVWDRLNASPIAAAFGTASTLIGVSALGYLGQLVEVDLTAALPE